jgi:hypothetical protein
MNNMHRILAVAAAAALLSACGGGDDIFDDNDPTSSGQAGSITVSAASEAALNGVYSNTDVQLNEVTKFNPIGGDPETCRFRFSNLLQQPSTGRNMNGDVRYIPGSPEVRTTFMAINGVEFQQQGATPTVQVDRTNSRVNYVGAVLVASAGNNQTITVNGFVPIRGNRPEGC